MNNKISKSLALVCMLSLVTVAASGCAAPTDEEGEDESGDQAIDDSQVEPEQVGTVTEELKTGECTVRVMFPKIGHTGVSVASNAWGNCKKAKASSLRFRMMTKGFNGWSDSRSQNRGWDFTTNVPYNGSYNLGGRQVSTAAISQVYVEATVCWTSRIRHCRSDSALLKDLN